MKILKILGKMSGTFFFGVVYFWELITIYLNNVDPLEIDYSYIVTNWVIIKEMHTILC